MLVVEGDDLGAKQLGAGGTVIRFVRPGSRTAHEGLVVGDLALAGAPE
jgi:hypothetical protein